MDEKIIIIDDDPATLKLVADSLEAYGFTTFTVDNGPAALVMIEKEVPDLAILDIVMPGMDGFEVCWRIRQKYQMPIIMLSARCGEEDKVKSLNLGADDYLCKPFGAEEITARIHAVLRRSRIVSVMTESPAEFTSGDLRINFYERQISIGDTEVALTVTEFTLLRELALNAPKTLSYAYLLHRVWGPEYGDEKGYLYVFIRRLRKKIEPDPQNPVHIISEREIGYHLK
jgi:two-component system, OmpR family, KDP operon response regulator KdpE